MFLLCHLQVDEKHLRQTLAAREAEAVEVQRLHEEAVQAVEAAGVDRPAAVRRAALGEKVGL